MTNTCCDPTDARDCDERNTCDVAGTPGHTMCGWCSLHGQGVHQCGCVRTEDSMKLDAFLTSPTQEQLDAAWAELEAMFAEA